MTNTTLIEILKTFTVDEIKKFGEMISSPFFNKQTPLIKLFDQIKKYHPDFKNEELRKETVYLKMFPDKKYNYGSMKNLIYELQKLSETFIADQEMNKNRFEVKRSLINSLIERNLITLSEKSLKELEKEITGKEMNEEDYFLKMHYINSIKQIHIFESEKGNINLREKIKTPYYDLFINTAKYLKKYYLLDTLRSYNKVITNKNILNTTQVMKDCDLFICSYNEKDFEDISLKLEISFLKMNLDRITDEEFLEFKKLVLKDLYEAEADKKVIFAYSIYLLNYCRIKNKTNKQYKIYAFEILKNLVYNDNLDCDSGFMNIVLARNIIIIATQLKEYNWCEKFLEKYSDKIHSDYRNNIMNFYNAHKNFYENNFTKSLEFLSVQDFDDIFNKSYIKELIILNYYELNYFDLLNEQLDSYKKFLANNARIPESYKIQCSNFIKYMYKLFQASNNKKTDLSYLKNKIQNDNELVFKDWFLKKLGEIE